ncbi:MAG: cytochrome c oxidase accessory protein FixG [Salibacteraceae bacterium]|jgi:cytochrome c oxidase accessory protein FixG
MTHKNTNYGEIEEEKGSFRDSIGTLNEAGNRKWVYPKKPSGWFHNRRALLAYILVAVLFGGPFIKIDGEPLLLFNIFERKFVVFGQIFWPQDFFLFVIAMLTSIVFVILFTTVYGRIFCGWVCPQTIFLEMVFRKIEYWIEGDWRKQKKLDKMPWNAEKIRKKGLKNVLFFLISSFIAHTFLSYIIGVEQVNQLLTTAPSENMSGFIAMLVFTGVFYGVFARFREQACIIVCPYGRLQGALLDNKSIVVAYDFVRGENTNGRSKFRKSEDRTEAGKGDCIDCHACVDVCPTGIDIRNGTQLECVNCTACIDACDAIMESINLSKGLIRYASIENIEKKESFMFTPRLVAYSAVLGLLVSAMLVLLTLRSPIEATILRSQGTTFQKIEGERLQNLYTYKIINKTKDSIPIEFEVEGFDKATIKLVGKSPMVPSGGSAEGAMFVIIANADVKDYKIKLKINLKEQEKTLTTVKTTFLGPTQY